MSQDVLFFATANFDVGLPHWAPLTGGMSPSQEQSPEVSPQVNGFGKGHDGEAEEPEVRVGHGNGTGAKHGTTAQV